MKVQGIQSRYILVKVELTEQGWFPGREESLR